MNLIISFVLTLMAFTAIITFFALLVIYPIFLSLVVGVLVFAAMWVAIWVWLVD